MMAMTDSPWGKRESLPILDMDDARMAGWEWGVADDGNMVLQATCEHGCKHSVVLPPDAWLIHSPPGELSASNVLLLGAMAAGPPEVPLSNGERP